MKSEFRFTATGIGSVPSTEIRDTCEDILKHLPEIPFWPQFVKRSPLEDMNIQFSEGFPLLEVEQEKRSLYISSDEIEPALVNFYDHFLAEDIDYFAISKKYAPGLYQLMDLILKNPERYGPHVKGQSVGPVTFAAGILDHEGKSVLHHPDLLEAFTKGLAIKALWQANNLGRSGKKPIIFLDEPYLSGFGSAFTAIERQAVIDLIQEVIDYIRERSNALIGVHCCGNTDWSMIIETGADIVNFDAFSFLDYFLLYPEAITHFLQDGGIIAWGIVPTLDFTKKESVDGLYSKLQEGLNRLHDWGLDSEMVIKNSILTPACGMGTMDQADAEKVLNLLSKLSERCAGS